jgi:hypothetical protein
MKVGGAPLKEDVARIAAAREAIGPDVQLMACRRSSFDERSRGRVLQGWRSALLPRSRSLRQA